MLGLQKEATSAFRIKERFLRFCCKKLVLLRSRKNAGAGQLRFYKLFLQFYIARLSVSSKELLQSVVCYRFANCKISVLGWYG